MDFFTNLNLTTTEIRTLIFIAGLITGVSIANIIRKAIWNLIGIAILSAFLYGGVSTGTFDSVIQKVKTMLSDGTKAVDNAASDIQNATK